MPQRHEGVGSSKGRWRRSRRLWLAALAVLAFAWPVSLGVSRAVSVRAYSIPTGSMAPTLKAGDRVGVQTRPSDDPKRGEVWVFRFPPAAKLVGEAVKRVIGLPGETVEVKGGRVFVDGRAIPEPYLKVSIAYTMPALTLGPGEYFVMGDSRNASHDSHVWGPLPRDYLVGPVTVRYWPLRRVGGL